MGLDPARRGDRLVAVAREEASTSVRTLGLSGRSELPIFRIYASDQAHSSVEKGAIALGLGEHNVRRIASDTEFRMNVAALREAVLGSEHPRTIEVRKELADLAGAHAADADEALYSADGSSCDQDTR